MSSRGRESGGGGGNGGTSLSRDWDRQSRQQQSSRTGAAQTAALFRRVCDVVQQDKASVEELARWAFSSYAGLVKGIDKAVLARCGNSAAAAAAAATKERELAGEAKLAKYRSRGLTYSVRHISPAILRRQRADRTESKELSVLVDELKRHRDLWESFLANFKDSLGAGVSAEQKESLVQQKDDKLYEIYKSIWPIVDKLRADGGCGGRGSN